MLKEGERHPIQVPPKPRHRGPLKNSGVLLLSGHSRVYQPERRSFQGKVPSTRPTDQAGNLARLPLERHPRNGAAAEEWTAQYAIIAIKQRRLVFYLPHFSHPIQPLVFVIQVGKGAWGPFLGRYADDFIKRQETLLSNELSVLCWPTASLRPFFTHPDRDWNTLRRGKAGFF